MDTDGGSKLYESMLPAGLFIEDMITDGDNVPLYRYEDWMRELINASPAFMEKTGGETFVAPGSEANGECDAVTKRYQIDFKLVLGQSLTRAVRETSDQKTVVGGGTFTGPGRAEGEMSGVRLHAVLRSYDNAAMRRFWNSNPNEKCADDVETDIVRSLRSLQRKKNLLLLYPCLLYMDDCTPVAIDAASDAVYSDYRQVLSLRREYYPGYENYIAYIADGFMVIIEAVDDGWSPFDSVPLIESESFLQIVRRYDFLDYGHIDSLLGKRLRK